MRKLFTLLPLVAGYFAAALVLQWLSGTYRTELGHHPDEPAHVVTALMIRDYVVSGFSSPPLAYAENYYIHYPKVGFGMWPPFFHSTAALWMMVIPAGAKSLLVFMALLGGVMAATLAQFARRLFSPLVAFLLGLFLLTVPFVQLLISMVMVDVYLTTLQMWAMMLLISYLRTERTKSAILFGLCTALAMLTKGNANALGLMVIFAVLLTRRFGILRRPSFYAAGMIAVLLGGPWQLISFRLFHGTIPLHPVDVANIARMFSGYTAILIEKVGWPIFAAAMLGLTVECIGLVRRTQELTPRQYTVAGAASLLLAVFLFHCVAPVPGPDDRYMLATIPMLLLFALLGASWLGERLPVPGLAPGARAAAVATGLVLVFALTVFAVPQRLALGVGRAAAMLPASAKDQVVLICSDSLGEGGFIAAVALNEPRPHHIVLRGSKILSENGWFQTDYKPSFSSVKELEDYLTSLPVEFVIIDQSYAVWEQDRTLLLAAVRSNPSGWILHNEIPPAKDSRHLLVYRRTGAAVPPGKRKIRVPMRITLGRDFELKSDH